MARARKLRSGLEEAKGYYEEWMEPDWKSTITDASSEAQAPALNKNRSKFKFANEYQRDLSTSTNSRANNSSAENRLKNQKRRELNWKPVDFERFYKWVINGTLKDLYKARSLLFDD
ncbi:unnamed protein product [Bursaphelenchus okinawaensis]|uniref:Uncharacterized protein n=1 Tax=Bursaphelenchus okinawaensis TaxID=465554 RepID=A0A811JTF6_9BILA|nr:unnamed protein product [Bursaphelenchus okinawaensis]CAG9082241.1 unnamed protein product [Bursaphelenchus okinawaensis]